MTDPAPEKPSAPSAGTIAHFFDGMSVERNEIFRAKPVLDYEQRVRSEAVLELLAAARGEVILDIGCGNARDIIPIVQAGARIVGVDISEGMIRQAGVDLGRAGVTGVELAVGDATNLRYPDASFDKVLCSEVIEHIPDASRAIAEIHRVLKPGGRLVISTPNRHSWYGFDRYVVWSRILRRPWNHPFDHWRAMSELTTLLDEDGLQPEASRTVCFVPGFLLTYRLPAALQGVVVAVTKPLEPIARVLVPRAGYLNVVAAVKRVPTATQ